VDTIKKYADDATKCPWKYSFTLTTRFRKFYLFAASEEELFLWLTSLTRHLGVNV